MALTRVPNPMLTGSQRFTTPYEWGAVPGTEMSADNSIAINAMFAAVAASYSSTSQSYELIPSFCGVRFNCADEIWVGGLRSPGLTIFGGGGGIYSTASGKIAFNMALCNRVAVHDFRIWGDATSPPAYGIYWGKALSGSTYPDSRGITFVNCMTQGYFSECAAVGFASETHSQTHCLWQNKSRSLTARGLAIVGHRSSIDNYFSVFTSANCTLPTVAAGAQSNLGHELIGVHVERTADVSLTIVNIPNGATTTVEVTGGTLAGANFSNGDMVRFYVTGMSELRLGAYEIENLDEANDTFDLVGIDSTSYGTFTAGTVQNATGPAALFNGAHQLRADTLYLLAYSEVNTTIDMSVGSALRNFHVNFQPERWNDNMIELVAPASGTAVCQDVSIINMGSNQQWGDSMFKYTGAGGITINDGVIKVINVGTAPPNLLFDDASKLRLTNVDVTSQIVALLNPASDYLGYNVKETAFDRNPKTYDYTDQRVFGLSPQADTQTNLRDVAATVNTVSKQIGKCVWDSTNAAPVWSTGTAAAAVWVDATGFTAHTPV